ncbi:hypothetical protein [Caballeronia sp. LZ043]|uniref:hypothetical protein n=1 Tax=Caballeronia sp. LZ043 TaxID=3038569 RepID=UPI00286428B1|nr:hypothetical protein [Caballeronia sp. LZ043]MDR5825837.1 hypothetical protein [Caballeronia sp. LZ043]
MKVKAEKAFEGQEGYVKRGDVIEVSEMRARELKRVGLVKDVAQKAAPAPSNKKAPEPENKAKAAK